MSVSISQAESQSVFSLVLKFESLAWPCSFSSSSNCSLPCRFSPLQRSKQVSGSKVIGHLIDSLVTSAWNFQPLFSHVVGAIGGIIAALCLLHTGSPWLSGSLGWKKVPENRNPFFLRNYFCRWNILLISVLQIHGNWGPDNRGPPVYICIP